MSIFLKEYITTKLLHIYICSFISYFYSKIFEFFLNFVKNLKSYDNFQLIDLFLLKLWII